MKNRFVKKSEGKKHKPVLMAVLIAALSVSVLLSGCASSENTDSGKTGHPENEGVDTVTEITGYTEYSGDNSDMFLQKGDKIAVISPSATPTQEQTDAVMKGLKEWGYVPVEGEYTCVKERTLQECIDDLTWALEDPDIKAIFCVRGGYAASEVMDELTLDMIRNAEKLIIGFSDITIYHSAWTNAGLPSVHGSMSGAFMDLSEECAEAEQKLMQGQIPEYKCEADENCVEGTAKGILVGGNLATVTATVGTEYDPTNIDEPYILFFEDVEEDFGNIHRYLTLLKHVGMLDNAQAIVFGEWTDIPEDVGDYGGESRGGDFTSMEDMISRQFVSDLDIPVMFGFPAGHGDVNYPLLMGEEATLTVADGSCTLTWQ